MDGVRRTSRAVWVSKPADKGNESVFTGPPAWSMICLPLKKTYDSLAFSLNLASWICWC